jgi:hypothetical protein
MGERDGVIEVGVVWRSSIMSGLSSKTKSHFLSTDSSQHWPQLDNPIRTGLIEPSHLHSPQTCPERIPEEY